MYHLSYSDIRYLESVAVNEAIPMYIRNIARELVNEFLENSP